MRFLTCLGVTVRVNPPRRPDLNAVAERYHKTLEYECLRVRRPGTLDEAREVTTAFREHYNTARPNQARSCGDRPPLVAFPDLPALPPVPAVVDADAWLPLVAGRRYLQTVRPAGSIVVEHARYYVGRRLAGQRVTAAVSAADRALVVRHRDTVVKRAPLHGLRLELLPFERYVELMCQEARSERRRRARTAAAGRVA